MILQSTFVCLTAYDTQKIKNMYMVSDSGELMGKKAVMGALTLYLDFIKIFTSEAIIIPKRPIIKKDPNLVKSLLVV